MQIAYLMNTYPITSTTFVRREIEALEARGVPIRRYAVRQWADQLVDPRDIAERGRTEYLLTGNVVGLLTTFFKQVAAEPVQVWRGLRAAFGLYRTAQGEAVRHLAYFLQAISLRRNAARDGIDHIHVHFSTNATTVAMLSRLMGGPSYSFTVHGPDEFDEARRQSLDAKMRHAAFVVAISHFCKSQLVRYGGAGHRDKIHVLRCGLDLGEFEPSYAFAAENQTFVCVGRLCPQKSQIIIPGAVAALRRDFPGLKVVLVGGGESRAEVEAEIARCGVGDMIDVRGWMANGEIRTLLRSCRALLLPSAAEGLPVVIMEAFALGRPALSTYIAGIPELIDSSCGWLVPAGSEPDLIAAMQRALMASPAELSQLGREGRARVEAMHDVDKLAGSLHGLMLETTARAAPAASLGQPDRRSAAKPQGSAHGYSA